VTLPPVFRQPLRPLSLSNALVFHNRPHPPLVGLVPSPPATPTLLAKRKGKRELLRLHPRHLLTRFRPPPQLTRISRDMICQLHLPRYMATMRHSPKNTPTPEKRRNSLKENTHPTPPGPPVILTPTGALPPPWPPKPPPPTLKLSLPLLRERRVDRRRPLPQLLPLRLRRVRFLRNLPLLSPSSPPSCPQIFRLQNHLRTPPRGAQDSSPLPGHCCFSPQRSQLLPLSFLHLHGQRQGLSVAARYRPSHPRLRLYSLLRSPYLEVEQGLSCRQLPLGSLQTRSK